MSKSHIHLAHTCLSQNLAEGLINMGGQRTIEWMDGWSDGWMEVDLKPLMFLGGFEQWIDRAS